jgi:LacI family transcriptional regulator
MNSFKAITMNDIAKALNLSASTVSKALSNSYEISEKTKQRVLEYAQANNYKPNLIAQSLKQGHSKSIGIVISSIDNHFFSQVINGIESIAHEEGYNVIFTQTHESLEQEIKNVSHLAHRSVDGLLISLSAETDDIEHLRKLQRQGLPIVFFDRVSNDMETHKVTVDNFKAAYEATIHLINSGFKQIAHITSSANTSVTKERLLGYQQAITDSGMPLNDNFVKYCRLGGNDTAELKEVLDELLTMPVRPDAFLTAFDKVTTGTLAILHERNLKIPQDVGIVGFTNTVLADLLNPSLSTVYQPGFDIGKAATEMLISLIKSTTPVTQFETIVLPTQLFIRNSTLKN